MTGSLLYLTTYRPDILFSIFLCARFQSNPKESHLTVVKRILRYLKNTTNLRLWYKKFNKDKLVGYCDVDYVGDILGNKSTSRSCQYLGYYIISWSNKTQSIIALSTAEAEYISASGCNT